MTTITGSAGVTTRRRRPTPISKIVLTIVVSVGAIGMLYPLIWLLFASFKPNNEIFASSQLLPQMWEFGNYAQGWVSAGTQTFGRYFGNSVLIALASVIGNVISCSLAAFAFGRLKFRFKKPLFAGDFRPTRLAC